MGKEVNVLVAVNVAEAIKSENTGNLGKFVFLMDGSGYSGDGNEGTDELVTTCENGDTIVWHVVSIQPNLSVTIAGFDGAIKTAPELIDPAPYPQLDSETWGGLVRRSSDGKVQYSMYLSLEGTPAQSFDPYIIANNSQ